MRKLHILGVAMFAVFAFAAVAASSASALSSVWLVNGALAPLTLVTSESLGVVLLEDMGSTPAMVNCEEVLNEGWVGPGSEDEVTSVVFMKKCAVPAKAEKLNKEESTNFCKSGTEATVDCGEPAVENVNRLSGRRVLRPTDRCGHWSWLQG